MKKAANTSERLMANEDAILRNHKSSTTFFVLGLYEVRILRALNILWRRPVAVRNFIHNSDVIPDRLSRVLDSYLDDSLLDRKMRKESKDAHELNRV